MTQLKTHIFETPKARVLVVDMPEGAIRPNVQDGMLYWTMPMYDKSKQVDNGECEMLPITDEGWDLLGKLSEITEEQWKGVVHSYKTMLQGSDTIYFKNYKTEGGFDTATESGLSLIESEVLLKNPHGEKPKRYVPFMGAGHYTQNQLDEIADYENELSNWDQAEEQVFHNPILFVEFKK